MNPFIVTGEDFFRILLLSLPLVVGGILHMAVVKVNILSFLKKPIYQSWFGANKTWRGFFVMPVATWPGVVWAQYLEKMSDLASPLLLDHSSIFLAFILGTAYCLAELPNSFMKRKMGIKEGQTSDRYKWLFVLIDQSDSVLGCLVAYVIWLQIGIKLFIGILIMGTVIHLFFNVLLYALKLRKNPF